MRFQRPYLHLAKPSDANALSKLAENSFREAFAKLNKKKDFETYVAKAFTESQIKSEIIDPKSVFYMAGINDQWVGYAKLRQTPPPDCVRLLPAIELCRFYSLPPYWGRGIGPALMEKCIDHACENDFKSIWLGSWKKNLRGNAFYRKRNFEIVGSTPFIMGSDIQEDYIFLLNLSS